MSSAAFEELKSRLISLVEGSSDTVLIQTIMDGIASLEQKIKKD